MAKRYTEAEKVHMAEKAIEAVENLGGEYPSFKNYVWAVQHVLKGGEVKNSTEEIVSNVLKKQGKL